MNKKILYILDAHKNPILVSSPAEWGRWFWNEDHKNRKIVKESQICTRSGWATLSTVFLGIDHNLEDDGPPLLFTTFATYEYGEECYGFYSTWNDAAEGHKRAIKKLSIAIEL